jgi:hypothetical protein
MPAADGQTGADHAAVAARAPDRAAEEGLATVLSSFLSQLQNRGENGAAPGLRDQLGGAPGAAAAPAGRNLDLAPRSPTGSPRVPGAPLPRRLGVSTSPLADPRLGAEQPKAAALAPQAAALGPTPADPPVARVARAASGNSDAFTHGGRRALRPLTGPGTAPRPNGTVGPQEPRTAPAPVPAPAAIPTTAAPPAGNTTPASAGPAPKGNNELRIGPRRAAALLVGLALIAGVGVSVAWWGGFSASQGHATSCQQGASLGQQISQLQGSFIVLEGRYLTALQSHDTASMQKDSSQMQALDEQAQTLSPEFSTAVGNCTHS